MAIFLLKLQVYHCIYKFIEYISHILLKHASQAHSNDQKRISKVIISTVLFNKSTCWPIKRPDNSLAWPNCYQYQRNEPAVGCKNALKCIFCELDDLHSSKLLLCPLLEFKDSITDTESGFPIDRPS